MKKLPAKAAYPVVIEYSPEDEGYVAHVPALKYCTAFGDTYEEAAREIQVAMSGWLAVAKARGLPVPAPRRFVRSSKARLVASAS